MSDLSPGPAGPRPSRGSVTGPAGEPLSLMVRPVPVPEEALPEDLAPEAGGILHRCNGSRTLLQVIRGHELGEERALALVQELIHRRVLRTGVPVPSASATETMPDSIFGPPPPTRQAAAEERPVDEERGPAAVLARAAEQPPGREPALSAELEQARQSLTVPPFWRVSGNARLHPPPPRWPWTVALVLGLSGLFVAVVLLLRPDLERLLGVKWGGSDPDAAAPLAASAFASSPDGGPQRVRPSDAGPESAPPAPDAVAPEDPVYAELLGRALALLGHPDQREWEFLAPPVRRQVRSLLRRAVKQNPRGVEALQWLALVELKRSQIDRALSLALRARSLPGEAPYAHLVIGSVALEKNLRRAARVAFRRFLKSCPRCRYASEVKAALPAL